MKESSVLVLEMRRQEATCFLMNWVTRSSEQGLVAEGQGVLRRSPVSGEGGESQPGRRERGRRDVAQNLKHCHHNSCRTG